MAEDRTPRWLSIPLVLIALGVLGFAIFRYVRYEEPKEEVPPPAPKGQGLPGPPPIPLPPPPPPKG